MERRKLKIKITESQLKRIVKSYNDEQLNEGFLSTIYDFVTDKIKKLIDLFKNKKIDKDEFKSELESTASEEEIEKIDKEYSKFKETKSKKEKEKGLKNIIIGDSQVPYVDMNTEKASRISQKGGENSLWEGGKSVSWLISSLKKYTKSPEVENVIICIGTNGGFGKYLRDDIPELFNQLEDKFPNADFYVVQGSWGWGGLKSITEKEVREYYKKYKTQGATIIEPPIGNIEPHGNKPVYKKIGMEIDKLL
jgi:siroheme synthase (precorrin-2 oxidase/ferrochelatase)